MQTSISVFRFLAQLYSENSLDEYVSIIYISLVINVTSAKLTEQGNVSYVF